MLETDVLIVGSGPAGGSAALMCSTEGLSNIVVTKHRWLADTPRAHYKNQRTMEILRNLGIEDQIVAQASSRAIMGDVVFCTSLTGDELGRLPYGANQPKRRSDYALASPCEQCDLPQHLLEPILVHNAATRGSHIRFDTEYLSHEQDAEGVTVQVKDGLTQQIYSIRAKYLLGADGGNSKVAADLDLPMEGRMGVAGSISIILKADLSRFVAHRPGYLWWILQPGSNIGGIGMGLLRMVRPWNEWQIVWGYDIEQGAPQLTKEDAVRIAQQLIGDDQIPVEIKSISPWTVNQMYASRYMMGRVFCLGDAVHRHPPSNGLGCNTSIQDAYNLVWKLALVLKGQASPALLETYNTERMPIGRQIVTRANQSIREFGHIFDALGFGDGLDAERMRVNIRELKRDTDVGMERRKQLRQAIDFKSYEFATQGVELNVRYHSPAVLNEHSEPDWSRDPELYYQPTTLPGGRLPHAWLTRNGQRLSSLDVTGQSRFVVLTGLSGQAWKRAADDLAHRFAIPVSCVVIGPGCDVEDPYGEWAELREVDESGCVLVRPDGYVAWRAWTSDAADALLAEALGKILTRSLGDAALNVPSVPAEALP